MDGGGWSALHTGWIKAHLSIIRDRPNQMEQTKRTKLKIYVETLLAVEINIDYKKKSWTNLQTFLVKKIFMNILKSLGTYLNVPFELFEMFLNIQ